jgi:hypothetical protein
MNEAKKLLGSATRLVLLVLVFTACYLSIKQLPIPQELNNYINIVLAFFFGTKAGDIVGGGNRAIPLG